MKLQLLEERRLLSEIRKRFSDSGSSLVIGIGDDAAVIKAGEKYLILTKDLLIEDIHFITSLHPPYFLGRKSLNVNLSDIAAMGGKPKYALLGLAFPSNTATDWLENYFSGFKSAAKEWDVRLAGGDISESKKITISVTVIGESKNIIRRSGAKPGHALFVSGCLGNAKQGFLLLKKGLKLKDDKRADPLLKAFLDPEPQLPLAQEISRLKLASSMIDISDGLSTDLFNLCQESRCGAEIYHQSLPFSSELRQWQKKPYDLALHGGEDYQLLFSIPAGKKDILVKLLKRFPIACIGKMIRERNIYLVSRRGERKQLKIKGYQHFA